MSFEYSKLRWRIRQVCGTQAILAKEMGLSERSLSLKLNGKVDWRQEEINSACDVLSIEHSQIPEYFFVANVQ